MRKGTCLLGVLAGAALGYWAAKQVAIPQGAKAVEPFFPVRYLGKWHEIARLDYRFERGLEQVTATYALQMDGTLKVTNRGYDPLKGSWEQVVGKARFLFGPGKARLKVSFWGPFYSGYNVIAIDDTYENALVAGKDLDYLWLLSRHREMPIDIRDRYLDMARELGYPTEKLIWTRQS